MPDALNLLTAPLLRVQLGTASAERLNLPELLARLASGQVLDFPFLRPHQQPAWHAFLVQLAFLALEAAREDTPPTDADTWRRLLRALTPGHTDDAAWCLVVDDWQQPAFLQSPCLAGAQGDYKQTLRSAQELDLLITSKNHDEKLGKLPAPGPDDSDVVVYALVSLQGFAGFLGAGNYNVMRMNGGFSSRPQFRLVPAEQRGSGPEFCRDLRVLLARQDELRQAQADHHIGTQAPWHRLLWLPAWGAEPLPLAQVHPLALEVCRRVRLQCDARGRLQARTAGSRSARVDAKARNGVVLDPWIPLVKEKDGSSKALTAQSFSFGYRQFAPMLFDTQAVQLPWLAEPAADERGDCVLLAQVLVGGSGRSDGLLRREVPMAGKAARANRADRSLLAKRARQFIELAGTLQGKVLRPALLQFIDGSAEPDWQNPEFDKYCKPWMARFDQQVDEAFFPTLFSSVEDELSTEAAEQRWFDTLHALADIWLPQAIEALPSRDGARTVAAARALTLYRAALYKQFPTRMPAAKADNPPPEPTPEPANDPDT